MFCACLPALQLHFQDLEKELLAEENKLRDAQDSIQEKGQMGFLRMAAQVDNFRKTSGVGTGDYEADAKAAVLTAMLPAFEPFDAAKDVRTHLQRSSTPVLAVRENPPVVRSG